MDINSNIDEFQNIFAEWKTPGNILCESIRIEILENVKLYWEKAYEWRTQAVGWEITKGSFWGDECVYYLDCGDGLMNMQKLILPQCKGGE